MEPIGRVLGNLKPPSKNETNAYSKSLEDLMAREQAIQQLIIRLYVSARKEIPSDDALEIEVRLALDDLKEIPDADLAQAFREAQVEAGGFIPTNGLIVKSYREGKSKSMEDAAKAIRLENTRKYLGAPGADLPTPEEREENARMMAAIAEKLAEGFPE
jgi:hypothetical protein